MYAGPCARGNAFRNDQLRKRRQMFSNRVLIPGAAGLESRCNAFPAWKCFFVNKVGEFYNAYTLFGGGSFVNREKRGNWFRRLFTSNLPSVWMGDIPAVGRCVLSNGK